MDNIFKEINELSLDKCNFANLGKFCYAFVKKDSIFIRKLRPVLRIALTDEDLQAKVMSAYTNGYMKLKATILQEFEDRCSLPDAEMYYKLQLELIENQLKITTYEQLIAHLNQYLIESPGTLEILNNYYKYINGEDGSTYIKENYVDYSIGNILYSKYQAVNSRTAVLNFKYSQVVKSEYEKIGINICQEDDQFSKYSLIKLNENIQIHNYKDSQTIYDNRIGKHFWIKVPRKLLTSIEELIQNKMLSDISFRIDYVSDSIPIMEEREFGAPLRLQISSLPKLSKFYSINEYENNLWISHDTGKLSLTFEELMADFEVAGDDIVTQVIHLEYKALGEEFFITHLDHEFIIYTLDSYQERLNDANTKGHRKIKTFKIDNAMIPFDIKMNNELFLAQVLDSYFKNKELVQEYFERINLPDS
ncbi:hypothetical protein [Acinetobacter sp. MB5]|uniref:hypothetical protein n=1 Tax=Acinetobacter sp. MB5 TaxID=2069438 RepID=UPI000DCF65E6|nr:hypothetical protein [Acinetobacter sp. MB5]